MPDRTYAIAIAVILVICCLGMYVAVTGYLNANVLAPQSASTAGGAGDGCRRGREHPGSRGNQTGRDRCDRADRCPNPISLGRFPDHYRVDECVGARGRSNGWTYAAGDRSPDGHVCRLPILLRICLLPRARGARQDARDRGRGLSSQLCVGPG